MTRVLSLLMVLLLVAFAGTGEAKRRNSQQIFDDYNNALRWNEFDRAWTFVDPLVQQANPLTELESKRFEQVQITGLTVKSRMVAPDGLTEQVIEIQLVSKFTQVERTLTDHQRWRWDDKAKRFWLVSGLPDITARD